MTSLNSGELGIVLFTSDLELVQIDLFVGPGFGPRSLATRAPGHIFSCTGG